MMITRNNHSFVLVIAVLMVQLLYLETCLATDINYIRVQDGGTFPNGDVAGNAPANALGGGNLNDVVGYAAQVLSAQLRDTHNLTIYYGWGPRPDLAAHSLLSQGGAPNREASGMIIFDNDGTSIFYITAEPDNQGFEYSDYDVTYQNLGSGNINDSKVHSNATTGPALNGIDLLSVSLHEIGHALGLSVANTAFVDEAGIDIDVDVTTPRPFSGSTIPIQASNSAHLSGGAFTNALMVPTIGAGIRRMPSAADILANAEIGNFVNPVLDLADNSTTTSSVLKLINNGCTSNFVNETATVGDNMYLIKCLPTRWISRGPISPIPSEWKPGLMIRIGVDGANFPIEINVTDYDTYIAWEMGELGPDNINGELSVVRDRRIHVLSGGWLGRPKQSLWRIDPLTGSMAHIADL